MPTRHLANHLLFVVLTLTFSLVGTFSHADDLAIPEGVKNTQDPKDHPPTPQESLKKFSLPEGFEISLFAGEPHVRQPIAFALDPKGRLWVAECYSYRHWKPKGNDRIVIFEDTDNDGQFDRRKVFWDEGNYLSGLQLGFGGVWVCCAPNFLFIPDRDGDDKPDGPPQVLLDGWSTKGIHNVLNGLTWGPDGWLYGANGITAPSLVGRPGDKAEQRTPINCGIWRYHPQRHTFEVVAHGTTNPWGLDFDLHGQGFFTNCVIGHLWHLIPGAHYKRMFGDDFNTHAYQLLDNCADHLHWTGSDWTKARGGEKHDKLGGGHAHCGGMIYYGDNWPDHYRGSIYTCNVHGGRVNNDRLVAKGSGYIGEHEGDLIFANDPWFRGVELKYGPDGGVYITDWTDLGECHDTDGIHVLSGRIYKVTYGKSKPQPPVDLAKLNQQQLGELLWRKNQWFVRQAQLELQQRVAAGQQLDPSLKDKLRAVLAGRQETPHRLRAMWALHVVEQLPTDRLVELLEDRDPHVRIWAIRLLREQKLALKQQGRRLADMAGDENAANVRLELASALQDLPIEQRWAIAEQLVARVADASDPNLPLMIWYGIEPAVAANKTKGVRLVAKCKIPLLRQFLARRITE